MKYPQCYIFLSEKTKLPALEVLQAWFETKRELYVRGVSRTSKKLNDEIDHLKNLHRFVFNRHDGQMQCVVISGTEVNPIFLWAHLNDVLKVYWIDSPKHAMQVHYLYECIYTALHFQDYLSEINDSYHQISKYIFLKTGNKPVGDDDIQRYFMGRAWGTFSEAEIHVKQIAKNETRAGILRRIDLEGIDTSPLAIGHG
jgi:hypothetical protein